MLTYNLKCNTEKVRETLGGDYALVKIGDVVRIIDSIISIYYKDIPICMYKSWRLTYNNLNELNLNRAEVLIRGGVIVRILRNGERAGLRELADGSPLIIHAMDVNERGILYRVFKLGGYVELSAKGVASAIKEAYVPKKGVNLLAVDLPLQSQFKRSLDELLELSSEHFVELHTTMLSDVCPVCSTRMDKRGRLVYCPKCKIQLSRDVNAVWALARNILRRLERSRELAELREIFLLNYPRYI